MHKTFLRKKRFIKRALKLFSKLSPFRACGDAGRARDCLQKKFF